MQSNSEFSRRALLAAGAASATVAMGTKLRAVMPVEFAETAQKLRPKICIFAKPIQDLSYEQIADLLAKYPVDGLEATVRTGGQVDPAKIEEQ